ncbi:hypothetical protein GCM10009846_03630 [Agrococcus versicolor]|uniref:Uncharacterized protein n=1 Tax=Agrococcus versicolor TaxID=501482 RepID=A0ABN3AJM2_9MICO
MTWRLAPESMSYSAGGAVVSVGVGDGDGDGDGLGLGDGAGEALGLGEGDGDGEPLGLGLAEGTGSPAHAVRASTAAAVSAARREYMGMLQAYGRQKLQSLQ